METIETSLDRIQSSKQYVELNEHEGLRVDLKYASSDNFMGENLYGNFRKAFLHKIAAEKLILALQHLRELQPKYGFVVFDALRPRSIQRVLWERVQNTPAQKYIGNPERGSMHNFGFAVDLSIFDENQNPLDMGAGFDDFRPISHPDLEDDFWKKGELSTVHISNRRLLRGVMRGAGFNSIGHEWWHFEALDREFVRTKYPIVE